MTVSLVALNGPLCGDVVRLETEADIAIGQDSKCTFTIDDAVDAPLHAHVFREASGWVLQNCDQQQSTLVNGQRLDRCSLRAGDVIAIGRQRFVFYNEPPGPSARPVGGNHKEGPFRVFSSQPWPFKDTRGQPITRLADLIGKLGEVEDLKTLFSNVLAALKDGLAAQAVRICVPRGPNDFQAISLPPPKGVRKSKQLLAEWVIRRDESILLELNTIPSESDEPEPQQQLWAIGLPIPGPQQPLGAIEVYCDLSKTGIDPAMLEFATAVAQLCGSLWRQIDRRQPTVKKATRPVNHAATAAAADSPTRILGSSAATKRLLQQIERVAPTDATVLTLGESGTGKELVARKIHELSARANKPYVAVNCAAFNESLLESELFGHEKGAFTGADAQRQGQFERADQGTIFLDEVGELSAACQAKLLRLLEGQPFERVGGTTPIQVDVRILAATHRNLTEMVQQGKFREDLWYRLRVIEVRTPPLRERSRDVFELAEYFLSQAAAEVQCPVKQLSTDAKETLLKHLWPGNVRELKNAMQRATVLGTTPEVQPDDLGLSEVDPTEMSRTATPTLAENERRHIQHVLKLVGGNKTEACRILGIGRATLYSKLSRQRS